MILYSGPLSLFARKIEIALAEKGLAYERIMVPFTQTTGYAPKNPEVLRVNLKGQVPVLIDGPLSLYDSTVILEYLEDAYPEPQLYPKAPVERARVRLLELEADEIWLVPLRALMFRTEPPGPDIGKRAKQEENASKAISDIAELYKQLDEVLQHSAFLVGTFSAADIATFMIVHYALRLGGPTISPYDRLRRWYGLLLARPGFAKVVAEIADADKKLSHPVQQAFAGL